MSEYTKLTTYSEPDGSGISMFYSNPSNKAMHISFPENIRSFSVEPLNNNKYKHFKCGPYSYKFLTLDTSDKNFNFMTSIFCVALVFLLFGLISHHKIIL